MPAEVAITAYDAGPVKPNPAGVGVYVRDLALSLARQRGDEIRFIGARPDGPLADMSSTLMRSTLHHVWVQRHANGDVRHVGADLVHYTNSVAPLRSVRPFVLTVQDLSLLRYPHYHPGLRLAAIPVMLSAIHRAKRVLVPSRATADELVRFVRLPTGRIRIVELAPADAVPGAQIESATALRRWGLEPEQFVLSIGTLEPRKNLRRLIRGFEIVGHRHPHARLVLMGGKGWRTRSIDDAVRESSLADRIVVTGYVSDAERRALLRHCAVFAYVSLYEGYGLPVVEAMAAGAPVVTSSTSSMPEAAGGAAILVDPRDPRDIARGVNEAWDARAELSAAGIRRVASLSWRRVAHETAAVYDEVIPRQT